MNRSRIGCVFGLALAVMLSVQPGQAASRSARYDLTGPPGVGLIGTAPDPTGVVGGADGEIQRGGVVFDPIGGGGTVDVRVTALDDFNPWGNVFLSVCQDTDDDNLCGEDADDITGQAQEPSAFGCVRGNGAGPGLALAGARKNNEILVFVSAFWGCPFLIPDVVEGQGGGTRGTITITW